MALENEEEVIGVMALVPDEVTLDLDDVDVVVVDSRDDPRLPVLPDESELFGEVDLLRKRTRRVQNRRAVTRGASITAPSSGSPGNSRRCQR